MIKYYFDLTTKYQVMLDTEDLSLGELVGLLNLLKTHGYLEANGLQTGNLCADTAIVRLFNNAEQVLIIASISPTEAATLCKQAPIQTLFVTFEQIIALDKIASSAATELCRLTRIAALFDTIDKFLSLSSSAPQTALLQHRNIKRLFDNFTSSEQFFDTLGPGAITTVAAHPSLFKLFKKEEDVFRLFKSSSDFFEALDSNNALELDDNMKRYSPAVIEAIRSCPFVAKLFKTPDEVLECYPKEMLELFCVGDYSVINLFKNTRVLQQTVPTLELNIIAKLLEALFKDDDFLDDFLESYKTVKGILQYDPRLIEQIFSIRNDKITNLFDNLFEGNSALFQLAQDVDELLRQDILEYVLWKLANRDGNFFSQFNTIEKLLVAPPALVEVVLGYYIPSLTTTDSLIALTNKSYSAALAVLYESPEVGKLFNTYLDNALLLRTIAKKVPERYPNNLNLPGYYTSTQKVLAVKCILGQNGDLLTLQTTLDNAIAKDLPEALAAWVEVYEHDLKNAAIVPRNEVNQYFVLINTTLKNKAVLSPHFITILDSVRNTLLNLLRPSLKGLTISFVRHNLTYYCSFFNNQGTPPEERKEASDILPKDLLAELENPTETCCAPQEITPEACSSSLPLLFIKS